MPPTMVEVRRRQQVKVRTGKRVIGDVSNSATVGPIHHFFLVMTNAEGQRSEQYRVYPAKHAVEV